MQWQWLLAGIAVVVVVLLSLWGNRSRLKAGIGKRRRQHEREPVVFGDTPDEPDALLNEHHFGELGRITPDHHLADKVLVDVEIGPVEVSAATKSPLLPEMVETPATTMTVILTVMAPYGRPFEGPHLQALAEELDLDLTEDGLFERFPEAESADAVPVFSMAHLRKPGTFDLRTLPQLTTPGLLLFMSLPGPLEGSHALNQMTIVADHLARNLGGIICDEHRNRLTKLMLQRLRSQVAALDSDPPPQPE